MMNGRVPYNIIQSPWEPRPDKYCIRYPYRVLDTVILKHILLFTLSFIRLLLKGHNYIEILRCTVSISVIHIM